MAMRRHPGQRGTEEKEQRAQKARPVFTGPVHSPDVALPDLLQRAARQPRHLTPSGVQTLQRAYGNRAVTRLVPQRGTIQRKFSYRFRANVGVFAGIFSEHNKDFKTIKSKYNTYRNTTNKKVEFKCLKDMIRMSKAWLKKHKNKNAKKTKDLKRLIARCETAKPTVEKEVEAEYVERLNKGLESKAGGFEFITGTSRIMVPDIQEETQEMADLHGLSKAELLAIRVYTSKDYKYINPILAGNKSWLDAKAQELWQQGWSPISRQLRKKRGTLLTKQQKAVLTQETIEHTKMATKGMKKLPNWTGEAYRGLSLTSKELASQFQENKSISFPAFTSTSLDSGTAQGYITPESGQVGIYVVMQVNKGKDIGKISAYRSESEVLLMPGSTFMVNKVTPPSSGKTYYTVQMTQTS